MEYSPVTGERLDKPYHSGGMFEIQRRECLLCGKSQLRGIRT